MIAYHKTEYLACAVTAKLVRQRLRQQFPGTAFSVRSKSYAGGASININWIDGPTEKDVNHVVGIFEGKQFDGMIDLAVSNYAWLSPDGSIAFAETQGTEGSMGTIPRYVAPRPTPNARRVQFGADYIHANRHYSTIFLASIAGQVAAKYCKPAPEIIGGTYGAYLRDNWEIVDGYRYSLPELIYQEAQKTST